MAKIHILDSDTINQIAAGEVVERPASVVKELVENAIDAGATAITAEIKEGGISFIRITDNGTGIPKEDIKLAFCRHATSKIATALDLLTVKSLGFRGEALSSIASVAMVELVTKTREEFTGSRYLIEGGEEKGLSEIGAPEGTTFLIRSLFYNTPARRKFLKSAMTEAGYISDLMERFAIAHPEVAFKFINNNKTMLQTSGNGNLKDCIYHIFGRDITAALLETQADANGIVLSGFLGKPVISRGNRNYENYFINGRYIKSNIISKAIEEAYKPYSMQHKYPFTVLHFTVPAEQIDVNVHPTKLEIRFTNGEALYQMVFRTVRDALAGKNMIPDAVLTQEKKEKKVYAAMPEPFEQNRLTYTREALRTEAEKVREAAIQATLNTSLFENTSAPEADVSKTDRMKAFAAPENIRSLSADQNTGSANALREEAGYYAGAGNRPAAAIAGSLQPAEIGQAAGTKPVAEQELREDTGSVRPAAKSCLPVSSGQDAAQKAVQLSLFEAEGKKEAFMKKEQADHHRIIGQLFATYWLVEFEEQLFLIDQHAAHEKILYEHTVRRMKDKEPMSQMISPPVILSLSLREEEVLKRYLPQFEALGFEIEEFGGREYSVPAVPADLYGVDGRELLTEMIDSLLEEPLSGTPDLILDRIASLSCKAAVKGNTALSETEAKSLISELLTLENPFHCPHGRPIIISMTKHEIERKFKRIVT